jgi:1-deoxy-D-xylulose-5-phosphate synthase
MTKNYLDDVDSHAKLHKLSLDELEELAAEVRQRVTGAVSQSGGHLASNLGITELTIAMHYVFDFARDRLVFDVGHQCYVHKMLTGRANRFDTLRKADGISGFPSPAESPTDPFAVGHAGTAIPTAVGLALGAQLQKSNEKVVAVVGDASIVNGVAFEGLNNTSLINRQLLIIFNDNSMGISKTEGALAMQLTRFRVSSGYGMLQRRTQNLVKRLPYFGQKLVDGIDRLKDGIKTTLHGHYQAFELMGMPYFGPVDGHDTASLITLLEAFKNVNHPVLLHVHTEKGRGFTPATEDPCRFHSPAAFQIEGESATIKSSNGKSFTKAFADAMIDLMEADQRVVAFTAAMPDGTGVSTLQKHFPDRAYDVGIAESGCTDIAAGLAKSGLKPVVCIYSTFLQRAFDQVFQEVSLQNLPVSFCIDRAGLVGGDGAVHQGFCDITLLRSLPNFVLMAPMDEEELNEALRFSVQLDQPTAMRYPRDNVPENLPLSPDHRCEPFQLGKAVWLRQGDDAVIISYGAVTAEALHAAEILSERGIEVGVINARFAKPLDKEMIDQVLSESEKKPVITVEDHGLAGGFGSAVLELAQSHGLDTRRMSRLGLPDRFIEQNSRQGQLEEVGLDRRQIADHICSLLSEPQIANVDQPPEKVTQLKV